jgi:hypothetical protein
VRYQSLSIVEIEKDVLSTAVNEIYLGTVQSLIEFSRTNIGRKKLAPQFSGFDSSTTQKRIETPNDDLYLRKFRH